MVPKSGLQHPAQLAFEIPAYPPITDHSPCLGSWQLSSLFRDPSLQYHLATRRVTLCLTLQTVTRLVTLHQVFPGGSVIKKKKNPPAMQEPQETKVRSLDWEDPLEEEMTAHSSVLSWEIPWTEEPGRL